MPWRLGDEGTEAVDPFDQSLLGQFAQRTVDRHAADIERCDQVVLRRQFLPRLPLAAGDTLLDNILDLPVDRFGRRLVDRIETVEHRTHRLTSRLRQAPACMIAAQGLTPTR